MEKEGSNISVVVRVRPVREQGSAVAVGTQGSREVVVRHSDNQRTYTFDRVFGPATSQHTIFATVVSPLLAEVLLGYNCTIFAYGQTGSGKTYTMEGFPEHAPTKAKTTHVRATASDVANNENNKEMLTEATCSKGAELSEDAGIIPRALRELFDILERDCTEYSVRVSYIEIYNEELRDLLTNTNPLQKRPLKLYEDLNHKGTVIVQGLEEVLVTDSAHALQMLRKGSDRRITAATKMNEVSSRSHGIFSVTVHIKESTSDGEELLKVGKLNLVDLAGSENIGRSGADNRRAKEAGMINQSLLTLGRVINALVERSPHIPYRESKLTRILTDSLGGRTKTCIIANVNPARANVEESLSTLEYANRAKNIRNKPEVNQKMTKRALIKEYISDIERLKSDLVAARTKNGIFLSSETYELIVGENESGKERIEEMGRVAGEKEDARKVLETSFNLNVEMLSKTSREYEACLGELAIKKDDLERVLGETRQLQTSLDEQIYISEAHCKTENELSGIADTLVGTLQGSVNDIDGLFSKLSRKTQIDITNRHRLEDLHQTLDDCFVEMGQNADNIFRDLNAVEQDVNNVLGKFGAEFDTVVGDSRENHDKENHYISELQKTFNSSCETQAQVLIDSVHEIARLDDEMFVNVRNSHSRIESTCGSYQRDLRSSLDELKAHNRGLEDSYRAKLEDFVDHVVLSCKSQLARQTEQHNAVVARLVNEIERVKLENTELQRRRVEDSGRNANAKERLIEDMRVKIEQYSDFVEERHNQTLDSSVKLMDLTASGLGSLIDLTVEKTAEFEQSAGDLLEFCRADSTCISEMVLATAKKFPGMIEGIETHGGSFCSDIEASASELLSFSTNINDHFVQAASHVEAAVRLDAKTKTGQTDALYKSALDFMEVQQDTITCLRNRVGATHASVIDEIASFIENIHVDLTSISVGINECGPLLGDFGFEADAVTGTTPHKRNIQFVETWERTKPHPELVREFRETFVGGLAGSDDLYVEGVVQGVQMKQVGAIVDSPRRSRLPVNSRGIQLNAGLRFASLGRI